MSKRINMTSRKPNPFATFGGVSNDDDKVADILAKSAARADSKDVDQWLAREAKINREDYEQRAQQSRFNQEGQELVAKAKHAFTELGMLLDQLEQQNEKALYKKYLKLQIALSQGWKNDINSLPRLLNKWESAKDDPVILQFLSNKVDRDYRKKYVTILPEAYINEADLDETDLDDIGDLDQEFNQKLTPEPRNPTNKRGLWWANRTFSAITTDQINKKFSQIKDFAKNQITVDKINTMFAQIAQMKELAAINNVNLETEHKDILQFENAVIEAIETNNINDLKILSEQYSSDQVQTQLKESVGLISNNVEEGNVEEGGKDDDDNDDEGAAQRKARI